MNPEIKRNLNKYGFKLAGELLGEAETNRGKPKLEWDLIDEEASCSISYSVGRW